LDFALGACHQQDVSDEMFSERFKASDENWTYISRRFYCALDSPRNNHTDLDSENYARRKKLQFSSNVVLILGGEF
jgi:hypothetical protein